MYETNNKELFFKYLTPFLIILGVVLLFNLASALIELRKDSRRDLSGKEKTANFFHNLALGIVDFVLNFFP
ncbi:hypothetical protein J5F27_14405 [Schleiferilactobacillus harbinensis]|uniref:hypothetical protein n=1 Tax=Schleiferilactobacillus harbinensis TaxID=304207 RepID=UPI001AAEDB4D|nr:hypothetical protein [Schleiferilactobacillus harbinensis]MBO3093098.1 hypothetical protein [Schleiferilactobacillus harbinensis]